MNAMTPVDELLDMIIVGAGISGIGMAVHLTKDCPGKSFAILDRRDQIGGTWDLFRYPGIRSDSDMHTLGFAFAPWKHEKSIADGPAILEYLNDIADEHGLRDKHAVRAEGGLRRLGQQDRALDRGHRSQRRQPRPRPGAVPVPRIGLLRLRPAL